MTTRTYRLTALALCFAFVCVNDAFGQQKRYTIEQFLETTSYRGASFSPDKSKILVSNDSTDPIIVRMIA